MSLFARYDARVAEALGGPPTKSQAIKLDGQPAPGFQGATLMPALLECLDEDCWRKPKRPDASNWQWRTDSSDVPESPEVGLERRIAQVDGLRSWTFQMSTCSGLRGAHTDKRRAVDLVRDYGNHRFAFIELKVGS